MVEQNGYVLLFACGKVGEVECFVWDRQCGIGSLGSHWQSLEKYSQISRIHSFLVRLVITY